MLSLMLGLALLGPVADLECEFNLQVPVSYPPAIDYISIFDGDIQPLVPNEDCCPDTLVFDFAIDDPFDSGWSWEVASTALPAGLMVAHARGSMEIMPTGGFFMRLVIEDIECDREYFFTLVPDDNFTPPVQLVIRCQGDC